MEIPSDWTLNAGDGARQLVKGMLVRQRLKTEEGWKYKLYAVAKVGEGSVSLVPVMVGGWSDSASGAVNVSPMSEVEYRLDEGAPYSEERYGATAAKGAPYRVTKPAPIAPAEEGESTTEALVDSDEAPTEQPPNEEAEPEERKEETMATSETVTKVAAAPVVRRLIVKKAAPKVEGAETVAPAETKVMRTGATKAKTPAKKSPLSARGGKDPGTAARVAARKAKVAPVVEAEAPEATNAYLFTLGDAANLAGVNASRVNSYRRAGLLPKRGGFQTQGRAVMYSQKAVDAILKMEEKGTKIPAPTRSTAATAIIKRATKRGRPTKGAKSTGSGQYGALGQAIAEAEALAKKYQRRAEQLKALAADEG